MEDRMADSMPMELGRGGVAGARERAGAATVPWYIWSGLAAVSAIAFGLYWDISWHMTIGRDTFWTPAHLLIQFGGIVAAVTCTYLVFATTFGNDAAMKDASVGMWGFRGPLGAFLCAWGGVTMVTSAPFDDWWHNSFGLDVQILSPPHIVLAIGILGVEIGFMVLLVAQQNRAEGALRERLTRLFLYMASIGLFLHLMLLAELIDPNQMHQAGAYRALALGAPLMLVAYGVASGHKWGATIIAASAMAMRIFFLWTFPLFPAVPKLGPVYTNVTHMVPLSFPVLIVFPAIAIDLVRQRLGARNKWLLAAALGTAYVATMLAVEWPWADFMVSPLARNRIFGMIYFPYQYPPSMYRLAYEFEKTTVGAFCEGIAIAWGSAMVTSRIGLAFGGWLAKIRR
jgi:hypothetical protein